MRLASWWIWPVAFKLLQLNRFFFPVQLSMAVHNVRATPYIFITLITVSIFIRLLGTNQQATQMNNSNLMPSSSDDRLREKDLSAMLLL
jgi:hypothetical protein